MLKYSSMKINILLSTLLFVMRKVNSLEDNCKKGKLGDCLSNTPMGEHKGIPLSLDELDYLCRSYQLGMECVEKWNKECLPPDLRMKAESQMSSVQFFMKLLCKDGDFRREYMNHTECFEVIRKDWDRCNGQYEGSIEDSKRYSNKMTYMQETVDLCCAKYGFNRCISNASKAKCNKNAAVFLRRISETLSFESRCDRFETAMCSASRIFTSLFGILVSTIIIVISKICSI